MNVEVRHNGNAITSHVIKYDREHKICTGIGMIELEVDYSYGGTFDPWDSIDIYENGTHSAKYYVSSVSEGQPSATIVVTAQDNSKRLSDYFITDSYFIDYPSYTRYWIETFLTEVGVSYTFMTDSMGSLLSNNTSLGLMSAYEQVIMLLQMSGWYIRFNSSGRAIIGKLDIDSAKKKGTINNRDVIEIKVDKNDRMYRNRVVVWGNGDPSTSRWVFAEVEKPTKWDYDSRDKRTILISNSNIPTVADAFSMANQVITEFAKLNIEKFMTVEDARNISVGDVVSLHTKVFSGKALVTTFGVSMSKAGLVSNIACDERCPRLFGFYNPGGYVYVGTYGSGIWRKHILDYSNGAPSGVVLSGLATDTYSGGWFDVSSGIMDLNVTDLHVNNGVLASVTSDGGLYYSLEDAVTTSGLVWSGVMLSGLQVIYSGVLVEATVYSGLMGRACIIDRDTNYLRYAVDTNSGVNYGDFIYETDPVNQMSNTLFWYYIDGVLTASGIALSGIMPSGRSWIIDADPYDGTILNTYPINVSGNYNFTVYDIENDGTTDYVEAKTFASGYLPIQLTNGSFEPNVNLSLSANNTYYEQLLTSLAYSGFPIPEQQSNTIISTLQAPVGLGAGYNFDRGYALYDSTPTGHAYILWSKRADPLHPTTTERYIEIVDITVSDNGTVSSQKYFCLTGYLYNDITPIRTRKLSDVVFEYTFLHDNGDVIIIKVDTTTSYTSSFIGKEFQPITTVLSGVKPSGSTYQFANGNNLFFYKYEVIDIYGFKITLYRVSMDTWGTSEKVVLDKEKEGYPPGTSPSPTGNTISYELGQGAGIWGNSVSISRYGVNDIEFRCAYRETTYINPFMDPVTYSKTYKGRKAELIGFDGSIEDKEFYDWGAVYGEYSSLGTISVNPFTNTMLLGNNNKLRSHGMLESNGTGGIGPGFIKFNYPSRLIEQDHPFQHPESVTISGTTYYNDIFHDGYQDSTYLAYNEHNSTWEIKTQADGNSIRDIVTPSGYLLLQFSGRDSFNGDRYFQAQHGLVFPYDYEIITLSQDTDTLTRRQYFPASMYGYAKAVGNFRVQHDYIKWVSPGRIEGYYPLYTVLQRDGYDFNVVKSGVYQDRLDISIYSPLVTMGRTIPSMETFFISMSGSVLETANPTMSGANIANGNNSIYQLGITADDYRYSDFEDTVESGTSRKIFVVYSGGVGSTDIWSLNSFSGEFLSPSGLATRIELSNFSLPDQYVFVSVSGYGTTSGWGFFQKSPSVSGYDMTSSGLFVDYSSGYPQARTTIIRLDDSI